MTVTRDGVMFVDTCTSIQKKIIKYAAIVIDTLPGSSSLLGQFISTMDSHRGMLCNVLAQMGLLDNYNFKVTTTTIALGTQGDLVLFSLVRNNQDKSLGALAELLDPNVSISRAKKKLIIVGSFEMMAGHGDRRSRSNYAHNLAKLVESKYGGVVTAWPSRGSL